MRVAGSRRDISHTIDRISSWRKMCVGAEEPYVLSRYIKKKTLCKADGGEAGRRHTGPRKAETPVSSQRWVF